VKSSNGSDRLLSNTQLGATSAKARSPPNGARTELLCRCKRAPHTGRGSAPPRRVIGASDARRVSTRHVTVGREAEHLRGALRIPV
jgi:hypothetical protein